MKTSSKEVVTGLVGLAVAIGCEGAALWLCLQSWANGLISWAGSQVSFAIGPF